MTKNELGLAAVTGTASHAFVPASLICFRLPAHPWLSLQSDRILVLTPGVCSSCQTHAKGCGILLGALRSTIWFRARPSTVEAVLSKSPTQLSHIPQRSTEGTTSLAFLLPRLFDDVFNLHSFSLQALSYTSSWKTRAPCPPYHRLP